MYRNSNGKPREGQPEQKNAPNPTPCFRFPEKNFEKTFNAKNLENQHLTQNRQNFLQKNFIKHLAIIEKRRTFALANQK